MIKKKTMVNLDILGPYFWGQEVIHDDRVKVMLKVDSFIQAYLFKNYKLLNPS